MSTNVEKNIKSEIDWDEQFPDPDEAVKEDHGFQLVTPEMEIQTLSTIFQDRELFEFAADTLPRNTRWSDRYTGTIWKSAKEFFSQYGKLPSRELLHDAIVKANGSKKDWLMYAGKLAQIFDYSFPTEPDWVRTQITTLTQISALASLTAAVTGGKTSFTDAHAEYITSIDRASASSKTELRTSHEVLQIAETQTEDWLIQDWLEFGSLGMMTGDPFGGKSCIVAELTAACRTEGTFGPYPIPKTPVLLIDLENRERTTLRRLTRALDGDLTPLETGWRWAKIPEGDLPLTPEKIERIVTQFRAVEVGKPLVIIDTLRSAFAESEMEEAEMKKLLYPLQRVAQRTEAAILILHHRPKTGAAYSGQTTIAGALDFLWVWDVNKEELTGKLSLYGTRGDPADPLTFRYDLTKQRNLWTKSEGDIEELVRHALQGGDRSQTELVNQVRSLWTGTAPGVNKVRGMIAELEGSLIIKKSEKGKYLYSLMTTL